ncbi:M17 family peptidase N-terminal domain-containing protein, partial [Limnohabitans sp.]
MNFEIQKRALSRVIRDDLDALVVLWPSQGGVEGSDKGPISVVVRAAAAHGDFEHKPGAMLTFYAHPGIQARHVVVVCIGEGSAAQVRSAVNAAWGALKSAKIKRLGLHATTEISGKTLQVAACALADASYSYTSTLSKPKPRTLKQVVFSAE